MSEKICPTCGTEYPANERFCPRDGTALRTTGESNDLVGSIIAERYHVMKKLGEGGMGQVYLAEHVKMGRKSAVKVMNPGMVSDADAISRFNREAANASMINHPNVAGIYDFGETSEGLIYLAMEFIEGESLTSIVEKQGALPPKRVADIIKQTADGLQVAHELGIVHRDLKPDNIMIAKKRDGTDLVKVVDFGIAKAAGNENQKVTKTGLVVGTPEYMSPEQLSGDKLNACSDIYSLALVAFNCFTGALPFQAESAQESMIMRLTDEPATLKQVKPDVNWTPEVQAVMKKALERKRDDRYQKASDFGNALWNAVDQMPKQPAAAATQMVGAMDGATAVMAPPPATRVDADARASVQAAAARAQTPASVPVVAPKSKMPMLAGGGVLALAIAAGAYMYIQKPKESVALIPPAAATDSTAKQSASPQIQGGPTTSTTQPANTPVNTPANSSTKAPPSGANSSVASRLPVLLDESAQPGKFEAALQEAKSLMSKAANEEERVGLVLVQAQALGMREDTARTCSLLRGISDASKRTRYLEDVSRLLGSC